MKKLITVSLFIFTLFISQNGFSQSSKWNFALFGGYSLPTADLKGDVIFNDQFNNNDKTYLQKSGFNFGGAAKYALDAKGNLQLVVSLDYNGFSRSVDTTTLTGKVKMNILSANVGAQYNFMPNQKVNPYVNVDFTNNFYSGSLDVTQAGVANSSTLKSTWRGGLQFGLGIDFAVSKNIGILVGGNYNLANLIGKDSTTSTSTTEYTLQDKEHLEGSTTIAARNISYLQVYAGVSIFINRSLKK